MMFTQGVQMNGKLGLWGALFAVALSACGEAPVYDFERRQVERGTLGEEVFRVLRKDAALSPRAHRERSAMLDARRGSLVTAIDTAVPEGEASALADLLLATRPLQDSGRLPGLTRKLALVFDEVAQDEAARAVWSERSSRGPESFVGPDTHASLMERVVSFDELEALARFGAALVVEHDGVDAVGEATLEEPDFMTEGVRAMARELARVEVTRDPDRLGVQLTGLLLRDDPAFVVEGLAPLEVTRLDARALPVVGRDRDGRLYSPFVDQDGDGLADVNGGGRFVDATGRLLDEVPWGEPGASGLVVRDARGLAQAPDGSGPLFETVDLQATAGRFVLEESAALVAQGVIFDLPEAALSVLPPRQARQDEVTGESYEGYPLDQPLMALAWAALEALGLESLDEVLDVASSLLSTDAQLLAELLLALEEFDGLRERHPEASLAEGNTLIDDLLPVVAQMAQRPGLLEDALLAFSDPVVVRAQDAAIDLLSFRGSQAVPAPDGPYEACFALCDSDHELGTLARADCVRACPRDEVLREPMDLEGPRSEVNRSHFERSMALLRDSRVSFELSVTQLVVSDLIDVEVGQEVLPPLLRIEDATVAFLEAVAGTFQLTDYVTEEAIDDPGVGLILDGMNTVCQPGFLGGLLEALLPELTRVTEADVSRVCLRYEEISEQEGIPERRRQRQRIAVLVSFLSLLTDVRMDEQPSAAQLARFFNVPNPRLDLELASLSLSQIVCEDGYFLWEHHGDMLYGAEATGLIDAIVPVARAFARHDALPLLAEVSSVIHQHYAAAGVVYELKAGGPSEKAARAAGVQVYEGLLRDWLAQGRAVPALQSLATKVSSIESRRGRSGAAVMESLVAHLAVPQEGLSHYDGRQTGRRADGVEVSPLSRVKVLEEALDAVAQRVESDAEAEAKWTRSVEALVDIFLGVSVDPDSGAARFDKPGSPALARVTVEQLAVVAARARDQGRLTSLIREDMRESLEGVLGGRALPVLVDLFDVVRRDPEDRALLTAALRHLLEDPESVGALLLAMYEQVMLRLADEEALSFEAHFLAKVLDPDRAWSGVSVTPEGLVSHGAQVLGETLAVDPEGVGVSLVRRGVRRSASLSSPGDDPAGRSPLGVLGESLVDYRRADPTLEGPLTSEDFRLLGAELESWLLDEQVGMEQVYDLVQARKR